MKNIKKMNIILMNTKRNFILQSLLYCSLHYVICYIAACMYTHQMHPAFYQPVCTKILQSQ